jgi:hypothetical protein
MLLASFGSECFLYISSDQALLLLKTKNHCFPSEYQSILSQTDSMPTSLTSELYFAYLLFVTEIIVGSVKN